MHNKLAVVDDTVITGSFNFSNNATQNAENVLKIESKAIADHFAAYVAALTQRYPQKGL
jgi:phosphatidylserine/phosphatidylglycerophosphate/cardiolipin synthase-like enzyme